MSNIIEQGLSNNKSEINNNRRLEQNIKYFMTMLFCMAVFLWLGYKASFFMPLGKTEARLDNSSSSGVVEDDYYNDKEKLTILVMGSDKRQEEHARSDTILVVFLDTKEKNIKIINIPRDTYVRIPGKRINTKINHAYAYGGITMAKDTVENFLDTKIDRYIEMDFQGFTSLIDALGGITYNVEKRMYYPAENIDLQPGLQTLNGEKALGYVRYRSDGKGDIGRIERQQKFLPVLADRVLSLSTLWKIPKLIGIFQENVETDFTVGHMLMLANVFRNFDPAGIETYMVPGEPEYINGVSYWMSKPGQLSQMIDELTSDISDTTGQAESQKETE
ncbi:MAG: LCP family protein [Bacillota bacterium]